jgi:hypothetical protein
MALSNWVTATATPATPATVRGESGRTVATVATVAVADSANEGARPDMSTPEQAAELLRLVAVILENDSDAERAEALSIALARSVSALVSFRLLAADKNPPPNVVEVDDRRRCIDCANLTPREHRCLAAWRGERPGNAPREYHPVVDLPRRCECFAPMPYEVDKRTGLSRWPYSVESHSGKGQRK